MRRLPYLAIGLALSGVLPAVAADMAPLQDLRAAIASNDWAAAQEAYVGVDWVRVDPPSQVLAEMYALTSNRPELASLRREIGAKRQLLEGVTSPGIATVMATNTADGLKIDVLKPVVVKPVVVKPVAVKPVVTKSVVTKSVVTKSVVTKSVVTKPALIDLSNDSTSDTMALWKRRYMERTEYRAANGQRLVPRHGSALAEAQSTMSKTGVTDAEWHEFNESMRRAVERRNRLGNLPK